MFPTSAGAPSVAIRLIQILFLLLVLPSVAWADNCPADGAGCTRPLWASLSGAGAAWWAASQMFRRFQTSLYGDNWEEDLKRSRRDDIRRWAQDFRRRYGEPPFAPGEDPSEGPYLGPPRGSGIDD
jgi:hypothetical protein